MADRTSFAKLQRDRKKKAKAAAKRDRRQGTEAPPQPAAPEPGMTRSARLLARTEGQQEISPDMLLSMVEALQTEYESGTIDEEEYEARKSELLSRVS